MTTETEHQVSPGVTITLDMATLLREGKFLGYGYDDRPVHGESFADELKAAVVNSLAAQILNDPEVKREITEQVKATVTETLASTLEREFTPANRYGEPTGTPITLREQIVKDAEEQVRGWMKSPDGYHRSDTAYTLFLRQVVDAAVKKDLNEELKAAREGVRARVQEFVSAEIAKTVRV